MERVDITIVGAGVVGLGVAASLASDGRNVVVIEKHDAFGRETSSRNSEVIHAGIYYRPGSLKARTCVEGNRLLYDICKEHNIPHRKTGKLIIASDEAEISQLEELLKTGQENSVSGLRMLNKGEIKEMEPGVEALCALYSDSTGIIDSHKLMEYFIFRAKQGGADIVYNSELKGVIKKKDAYEVSVRDADGEDFSFLSSVFINCAGLESDTVAAMVGIDVDASGYRLKYSKGQYFRLFTPGKWNLTHLVYPVPETKSVGLGIHVTLDLGGGVRLGPDANYIDRKAWDYDVEESAKEAFYSSVRKFLPSLAHEDLCPDIAGIRPALKGPEDDFKDFVITHEDDKGFPGFINLIGIESPGLTAAPSIARYVSQLVKQVV
ncbi:MAG: NAD(P)/FAD-dependent oxidoreductase [bacterium]